jgi:hypothetical protein
MDQITAHHSYWLSGAIGYRDDMYVGIATVESQYVYELKEFSQSTEYNVQYQRVGSP